MQDVTKDSVDQTDRESGTADPDSKRSQQRPLTDEEKLELGVEDSMEASDPPSVVAPGDDGEPHPSSGFRE